MADLRLVWDQARGRADWTVVDGQLAADSALSSVVLLLLFTDRQAQPDYVPADGSGNRRGWWADSFQAAPIGSRLWQLERRKITDRGALAAEAKAMLDEALQPMVAWGVATAVACSAAVPPASPGSPGTLLALRIVVTEPSGQVTPLEYAYSLN